jgi:EpsI family protein
MKSGYFVRNSILMAVFMVATAVLAFSAKPTRMLADTRQQLKIDPLIPVSFDDWVVVPSGGGIVNPQAQDLINRLYSETVSRIYQNSKGRRVILSVAYGKNQGDDFQVHKPEICYPAQGFQVLSNIKGQLVTPHGVIPVRRLETVLNQQRQEPVTYWSTLGDYAVAGGVEKKMLDIRYAMNGFIADGLLFRLSSIDRDSAAAFELHEQFTRALLSHVGQSERTRLAGLSQ